MLAIVRLLVIVGVLGGLTLGAMLALDAFVEPEPREYSVPVPPSRFNR